MNNNVKTDISEDFSYDIYCKFNKDLVNLTEEDAILHFKQYGHLENRRFRILPNDFVFSEYLELNNDIDCQNEEDAIKHYIEYGYPENRQYKKKVEEENKKKLFNDKNDELTSFCEQYQYTIYDIDRDNKIKFRYLCYFYLKYMKQFSIPPIKQNLDNEAVLVEFRKFPHIEFIVRNNILKLGINWSFTIVCGNNNYEYIKTIVKTISSNIKIIKTDFGNISPSEYSLFIADRKFWKLLNGRKILLYQEDSLIFKSNIDQFLYYDYIGAPWPNDNNGNNSRVGNGGLSLRTKRIMEKIIDTRSMNETNLNSHTIEYMKRTNSFVTPEDIYFTKNMEDLKIGKLAPFNVAKYFSQESIPCEDCFGGHNFWIVDPGWERKMSKHNIIQFRPHYELNQLEHRGGWKFILQELENYKFFSKLSNIDFFDVLERQFLWQTDFVCTNRWVGIIHCTPKTPNYLNDLNIEVMFKNENFIKSLNSCVFILTLSPYITNYLKKKINLEMKLKIKIFTIFHPVVSENIPLFKLSNYLENEEKYLIQVGQQLRKISTIYFIKNNNYKKLWLTGCKDFSKMEQLRDREIDFFNLNKDDMNEVKMYYTKTFEEFDLLLTKNIVIINLFDAAANNTVLECIIRNTPIIINRLEGTIDYLGENYPLFFDNIEEIDSLLDVRKIKEAHLYLKKMDKNKFKSEIFVQHLFDLVYDNFMK
jgi:hypothetical protein